MRMDMNRRRLLMTLCATVAAVLLPVACGDERPGKRVARRTHPSPRASIDASNVASRRALADFPLAIPVFDMVRSVPIVMDSIRCDCNCVQLEHRRSLLACFEGDAMAKSCDLCLDQARRVYALHRAGKSIGQIQLVIDATFG